MNKKQYMSDELIEILEPIAEVLDNDYSRAYNILTDVLNRMAENGADTLEIESFITSNLANELYNDAENLWNFLC